MKSIVIFGILILPCLAALSQKDYGYIIRGKLSGLIDGTVLYLIRNTDRGRPDTISHTRSEGEKFSFKGIAQYDGEAYFIKIDTSIMQYKNKINGYIVLLIENKEMSITGMLSDLDYTKLTITGSDTHNDFVEYRNKMRPFVERSNKLAQEYYKTRKSGADSIQVTLLKNKVDSAKKEYPKQRSLWIYSHPNSLLTPWLIPKAFLEDKDTIALFDSYERLSTRSKKSKYGVDLNEQIKNIRNTAIGSIAQELLLPNTQDSTISLMNIISQNKVTLVDFWASWCKPCRDAFPEMKKIYEKYTNRGFNIIGISKDFNKKAWRKSINDDNLPWLNVYDEGGLASRLYLVKAIPSSFLLNSKGEIIARWTGENNKELARLVSQLVQE